MNKFGFVIFILTVLVIFSCDKEDAPDCFQKAGERIHIDRSIDSFHSIAIEDHIDLIYAIGDSSYLTLEGPENLLNEIITEIDANGKLSIKNENTCNFVRNLSPDFKITFHRPISSIVNQGVGEIFFRDTMTVDVFSINCLNSAGDVHLKLQSDSVYAAIEDGVGSMCLEGHCIQLVCFHQGINTFDAKNMFAESAACVSNSIQNLSARCEGYLYTRIQSTGNIIYYGDPDLIDVELEGTGALIEGE